MRPDALSFATRESRFVGLLENAITSASFASPRPDPDFEDDDLLQLAAATTASVIVSESTILLMGTTPFRYSPVSRVQEQCLTQGRDLTPQDREVRDEPHLLYHQRPQMQPPIRGKIGTNMSKRAIQAVAVSLLLAGVAAAIVPSILHAQNQPRQKVIVLGFDGADAAYVEKFMNEGKLPHLAALRARGTFRPLRPTLPAQRPVSWSTFSTGID